MKTELLEAFENELLNEAKRLVPIVYTEKSLIKCLTGNELYEKIDNRFENFYIDIELRTCRLCDIKASNEDYKSDIVDINKVIEHSNKCIKHKKDYDDEDLHIITNKIAKDIIYNKYTNETIYSIIPKLCNKYMKTHNDSVEHTAIIMLLEDELYDKGYILRDTDLNKLDVLK